MNSSNSSVVAMLKTILKVIAALVLAIIGGAFYLAGASENVEPDTLEVADLSPPEGLMTIAFGSCNREDKPQDFWPVIAKNKPETWLWLGDNVYADTGDRDQLQAEFDRQKNAPEYAAFLASVKQVYGIYDDHDYGLNDGGKEWEHKAMAQELLLDFLDVPADAAVRSQAGVYQSYTVGEGNNSVKIILLDTRYFRDAVVPPTKKGHRYGQNANGDILGEAQWAWLEKELTNSPAAAHVIGSSIQVLPQEHGYEKWDIFPAARERLLALLSATRPALPILLSGDRHLAEISRVAIEDQFLYEITASGLTHSYEAADEPNAHRVSPLIGEKNFGLLHFLAGASGLQLLAEVRAIDNNEVLTSLAIGPDTKPVNKAALSAIIHPKDDMLSQLKECPESPNCVSTQTAQADKKREAIPYTGTFEEAKEKLKRAINSMPRTTLKSESGNYLHYTFKTFLIPFTDDVEFLFDEEAKLIHYRSASRVGHSDLGANSRRMNKVVKAFHEQ